MFAPIRSSRSKNRCPCRAGLRVLGNEEDRGRELIQALDAKQRDIAIFNRTMTPGHLMTMSKIIADPLKPAGIGYNQLTVKQRERVLAVVEEYRPDAR